MNRNFRNRFWYLFFTVIPLIGIFTLTFDNHYQTDLSAEENPKPQVIPIRADTPPEYQKLTNPLKNEPDLLTTASTTYTIYCVSCHGTTGRGDTPSAMAVTPRPTNLADKTYVASLSDGYLFWRIAEGGVMPPFNSTMPPYKALIPKEQIWKLVLLIRNF